MWIWKMESKHGDNEYSSGYVYRLLPECGLWWRGRFSGGGAEWRTSWFCLRCDAKRWSGWRRWSEYWSGGGGGHYSERNCWDRCRVFWFGGYAESKTLIVETVVSISFVAIGLEPKLLYFRKIYRHPRYGTLNPRITNNLTMIPMNHKNQFFTIKITYFKFKKK